MGGGLRWRPIRGRLNVDDRRQAVAVRDVADAVDGGRMSLRQKQSLFAYLAALLIIEANRQGYEVTFGEAWRSPEEAARLAKAGKGIKASLHGQRLAIDLNLFKDGVYLRSSVAHQPLGEFWEGLNVLCRWGGRFGDGGHYSLEHGGRK
jgi:hypothetical protein